MAKPGDVVEFKAGLHGIDAPRNLGVFVRRWKHKGTPWVELVTVDGRKELKAEHLTRRAFKERYEGRLDAADTADVQARLGFLIGRHTEGALVEEVDDDLASLEEELWEAVCDDARTYTEPELAQALYGDTVSPAQLKQVRAALDRCRRPGVGRFETQDKGDRWRPWSRGEAEAMRTAWSDLEGLRRRLVQVEETEDGRAFCRVDLDDADLTGKDRDCLQWVKAAMVQFIDHDGVPQRDVAGIGGLGATNVFGMDLHRILGYLAQDWIRSGHTTRSSDYVHFLIETGLWDADDAVQGLMRRHVNQEPFFEHVEDAQAEADADALPEPDIADDPDRTDLRHLRCFTIDPPDAKDFDDAVGIEEDADGTHLWVHIADVSHYVRPGTHLDRHAKKRATSVYLPGRVLPMLPHRIADHLCSLRDDGDRFAVSARLTIGPDGDVTAARFHRSIIRVTENLAYADALERRNAGDAEFQALFDLADRMRATRQGLALETGEVRVHVGEHGFSSHIKEGDDATRMIETFMVAANVAVATHLAEADVPLLFRCHPLPDRSKTERFQHQAQVMGIHVDMTLPGTGTDGGGGQSLLDQLKAGGGSINLFGGGLSDESASEDDDAPEEPEESLGFASLSEAEREEWLAPFRAAVEAIRGLPKGPDEIATWKLLSCMGRAYYTPGNEGHFGLGATHYCHFTSPIRRYPDLVVHRNLKHLIAAVDGPLPHAREDLDALCDHCSDQERAAESLERRVKSAALVLASLHGEDAFSECPARVSGVVPGGLFVTAGPGIDARINGRDLPGGPYLVDEWESMLFQEPRTPDDADYEDPETGEPRKVRARLGDAVTVRLAGRNVADGRTDAVLSGWE